MEVELRLKIKDVTIELSPEDARELVSELAKLTGQRVDAQRHAGAHWYGPWEYRPADYREWMRQFNVMSNNSAFTLDLAERGVTNG